MNVERIWGWHSLKATIVPHRKYIDYGCEIATGFFTDHTYVLWENYMYIILTATVFLFDKIA